jgi:hypothetical protein
MDHMRDLSMAPLFPASINPSIATLHAALCALMTQFMHHRGAHIADAIAGYLRRIADHPDRHQLGAQTQVYRDLAVQWDNVSKKIYAQHIMATEATTH